MQQNSYISRAAPFATAVSDTGNVTENKPFKTWHTALWKFSYRVGPPPFLSLWFCAIKKRVYCLPSQLATQEQGKIRSPAFNFYFYILLTFRVGVYFSGKNGSDEIFPRKILFKASLK